MALKSGTYKVGGNVYKIDRSKMSSSKLRQIERQYNQARSNAETHRQEAAEAASRARSAANQAAYDANQAAAERKEAAEAKRAAREMAAAQTKQTFAQKVKQDRINADIILAQRGSSKAATRIAEAQKKQAAAKEPSTVGGAITEEQKRLESKYGVDYATIKLPGQEARTSTYTKKEIAYLNIVKPPEDYPTPTKKDLYQAYTGPRPSKGDPFGINAVLKEDPTYTERNYVGPGKVVSQVAGLTQVGDVKYQEAMNRGYTGYTHTKFGGGMGGELRPEAALDIGARRLFQKAQYKRELATSGVPYVDFGNIPELVRKKQLTIEQASKIPLGTTLNIKAGEELIGESIRVTPTDVHYLSQEIRPYSVRVGGENYTFKTKKELNMFMTEVREGEAKALRKAEYYPYQDAITEQIKKERVYSPIDGGYIIPREKKITPKQAPGPLKKVGKYTGRPPVTPIRYKAPVDVLQPTYLKEPTYMREPTYEPLSKEYISKTTTTTDDKQRPLQKMSILPIPETGGLIAPEWFVAGGILSEVLEKHAGQIYKSGWDVLNPVKVLSVAKKSISYTGLRGAAKGLGGAIGYAAGTYIAEPIVKTYTGGVRYIGDLVGGGRGEIIKEQQLPIIGPPLVFASRKFWDYGLRHYGADEASIKEILTRRRKGLLGEGGALEQSSVQIGKEVAGLYLGGKAIKATDKIITGLEKGALIGSTIIKGELGVIRKDPFSAEVFARKGPVISYGKSTLGTRGWEVQSQYTVDLKNIKIKIPKPSIRIPKTSPISSKYPVVDVTRNPLTNTFMTGADIAAYPVATTVSTAGQIMKGVSGLTKIRTPKEVIPYRPTPVRIPKDIIPYKPIKTPRDIIPYKPIKTPRDIIPYKPLPPAKTPKYIISYKPTPPPKDIVPYKPTPPPKDITPYKPIQPIKTPREIIPYKPPPYKIPKDIIPYRPPPDDGIIDRKIIIKPKPTPPTDGGVTIPIVFPIIPLIPLPWGSGLTAGYGFGKRKKSRTYKNPFLSGKDAFKLITG